MVLVTGATGFVGAPLTRELLARGWRVRAHARQDGPALRSLGAYDTVVGDLRDPSWMTAACRGITQVIHPAGISHRSADEADHLAVNRDGTAALAEAAAEAGVERLVFVSSVAAYGVQVHDQVLPEISPPVAPVTEGYGRSKLEAEQALLRLPSGTGLEVVIVRPPLIYGAGVKGNLRRLVRLADTPLPLPFGAACGRRSIVALRNVVDFLIHCAHHPAAGGETFVVADAEPVTSAELVREIRVALGRRPLLWPVPPFVVRTAAALAGHHGDARLLFGAFEIDAERARRLLQWEPPQQREAGIAEMVATYKTAQR